MSQELTVHQQNVMGLRKLAESPAYLNRFKQVLNDRAPQFVASLVQVVSSSSYLAKCDPNTIMAAAITAAALDLPIDKNLGFAHIVPYKDQAQFQMGYKGFVQLAVRTGQYKFLNCCVVRKGELVKYDELTGEVVLDPTKREANEEVIGYAAYFKLMNGYEHAEYWTKAEVEEHARRYSQAYKGNYETPWKTNFDGMALKTVIKSLLSHWGIMSIEMQRALTNDQGVRKSVDSDDVAYPDNEPKRPVHDGPADIEVASETVAYPATVAANAAAIEAQAKLLEKPYETIVEFCKRDSVTLDQVFEVAKAKKMTSQNQVELNQLSDAKLRDIVKTWGEWLPKIKAAVVA